MPYQYAIRFTTNLNTLPATPASWPCEIPGPAQAPGDVTCGVALKAIPKKKAKGNEESAWK